MKIILLLTTPLTITAQQTTSTPTPGNVVKTTLPSFSRTRQPTPFPSPTVNVDDIVPVDDVVVTLSPTPSPMTVLDDFVLTLSPTPPNDDDTATLSPTATDDFVVTLSPTSMSMGTIMPTSSDDGYFKQYYDSAEDDYDGEYHDKSGKSSKNGGEYDNNAKGKYSKIYHGKANVKSSKLHGKSTKGGKRDGYDSKTGKSHMYGNKNGKSHSYGSKSNKRGGKSTGGNGYYYEPI